MVTATTARTGEQVGDTGCAVSCAGQGSFHALLAFGSMAAAAGTIVTALPAAKARAVHVSRTAVACVTTTEETACTGHAIVGTAAFEGRAGEVEVGADGHVTVRGNHGELVTYCCAVVDIKRDFGVATGKLGVGNGENIAP